MGEGFDAGAAVRAVARFGLPDVEPVEPFEVPEDEWPGFFGRLCHEKLVGIAVAAMEGGVLQLDAVSSEKLLERQGEDMAWCLELERLLLDLADAFDDAGIEFVVLKGPAVAHTMYPDPSWRPFVDIDLLVRTRDWRRTLALFADLGLKRRLPEPRPGFDERFGKGACHRTPDGKEIDLHRTLALGPFGLWIRPDELFDQRKTFVLAGRWIGRLDDTSILLNVAMHASLGSRPPRLAPLRDVLQVSWVGDIECSMLARWAREWRLAAVLQHAFTTAAEVLRTPLLVEAGPLLALSTPRSEVRSLVAYTGDGRDRGGTPLGTLRAIPGIRSKVAYARALLLPDGKFLDARAGEGMRGSYRKRLAIPWRWLTGRAR